MEHNWLMEVFDTIASLSGKWARWLNVKGKRTCFIIWSIVVIYWCARDIYVGFYSQAFFCTISFAMHIYGYYNWGKKGIGNDKS